MTKETIFQNPIIAEQSRAEVPFVPDKYLGHTMPKDRDFIGESDYINLESMIEEIKGSGKKVILNIGDSSTSGWDSNVVTENKVRLEKGEELESAFFRYKTYSDYLRDQVGGQFIVINAGVPAHTSLQGRRRLEKLVAEFKNQGIKIDYVTAYYGNNDSVWEENREDKDWIAPSMSRKIKKWFSKDEEMVVTRTSPDDYQKNKESIVRYCRSIDMVPILIKPPIPLYWKPGTRVKEEELQKRNGKGSGLVYDLLDRAREIWQSAISQDYSELKKVALEEAREKDYVVPRIKKQHAERLRQVEREMNVPLVQIDLDRSQDDIRYFIDYCHPIDNANEMIAGKISEIVEDYETGKRRPVVNYKAPLKYVLLEKAIGFLSIFYRGSNKDNDKQPPSDIYTLH